MFKRTQICTGVLVALAVGLGLPSIDAQAQSNTSGNVFGTVQAGDSVQVENVATGFKRVVTPDASGKFVASALPVGTYKVTLLRNGAAVGTPQTVEVLIGQGTEIVFAGAAASQSVSVTSSRILIDQAATANGSTFTARELDSLPVAKNINAIVQMAPNTTRADPRYSGGASFGGGAPSENSYYINGFPVTNPLNQLGSSELPFGAIGQAQVLTGGFGAEFGRSIGGVVNITTKSGTNEWHGGAYLSYAPNSLRSKQKDLMYADTGAPENAATDGTLYRKQSQNTRTETSYGAYVSGPIIQDKLVMFLAVDQTKDNRGLVGVPLSQANATTGIASGGWEDDKNTNTRYLAKFDFNITQDHLLEATLLGDTYKNNQTLSGYNYHTFERTGVKALSASYTNNPDENLGVGAEAQILKYTGFITKDFTLSALYGQSVSKHKGVYDGVDVNSDIHQVLVPTSAAYPGFTYNSPYPFAAGTYAIPEGSKDKVKAFRVDLEYRLGDHTIRGGYDDVKLKSFAAGDVYAGNGLYSYYRTTTGSLVPTGMTLPVSTNNTLVNGGYYYYGREQIFSTVTNAQSNQTAYYLEDQWQVMKNLRFTPGLRLEKYSNLNGDGVTFLKVKDQLQPRLALSWDPSGDNSLKVFGSAGRYGVQIPTHLAVRGASRSTYTRQFFTYTGVDANGAPIGRTDLGEPFSANNEYGQAKDANVVAAQDMRPNSQDELTLGIEKALSQGVTVGSRITYRKLVDTIDDTCDPRPFEAYATRNGIDTSNWGGFGCASFNPGRTNTFLVDYSGNHQYTRVTLSPADMGYTGDISKAKRSYFALDFFAEHPLKDGWYGKVTYTYSRNKGNTEGQTLSDVAQTDVAATQTWDHPELMLGSYGYLPNDRRHQLKAYGFVRVLPEVDVGANLLLAKGRPKNCIGNFGGTPTQGTSSADFDNNISYGSAYRYCTVDGITSPATRGSQGYLPWDFRVDLNLSYKPTSVKGLTARIDVFNVFNKQTVQAISEVHEVDGDSSTILGTYGRTISYTSPRSVKFTLAYDF